LVCVDTGASVILAERDWVKRFAKNPRFSPTEPRKVGAVGSSFTLTEDVTFDVYFVGTVKGTEIKVHTTITVGIVEKLLAYLLLGTPFCDDHGMVVDFNKKWVKLKSAHDVTIPATVENRFPITRRVTAQCAATIFPDLVYYLPVNFVDLPEKRDEEGNLH